LSVWRSPLSASTTSTARCAIHHAYCSRSRPQPRNEPMNEPPVRSAGRDRWRAGPVPRPLHRCQDARTHAGRRRTDAHAADSACASSGTEHAGFGAHAQCCE
jgi:hypothetical protein